MEGDHYIYVIGTVSEGKLGAPVKVGITSNAKARLKQVQTGSPKPVEFAYIFYAPDRQIARDLETAFHQVMKAHRLVGEWFDIPPVIAVDAMCSNIRAALNCLLSDWSEEDRARAYETTGAVEAEKLCAAKAALAASQGSAF